jgi:hypothetical protein
MALSAFADKAKQPTDADVGAMLGSAFTSWTKLRALIAAEIDPLTDLWAFTSASTGWGLRLRHKDRVIVYMTPQRPLLVSLASQVALPPARQALRDIVKAIDGPRLCGRARRPNDCEDSRPMLARLARIKWQN